MLELIDVSLKRDNKEILDKINLKLDEEKFYVITGPNGSGKSSLAKIIMGIEKPTEGKIIFNGIDITDKSITERSKLGISFAFQQPVNFKGLTVYDLLEIAIDKEITKKEACDILSKVGMCALNYIDREVNTTLSGGELKRIEIATVIAKNPKLAIFDEPEAGIDLWSFQNLISVFKQLEKDNKGIMLVISHQEKILNIADQIILLENGKIKKIGSKNVMLDIILKKESCCKEVNICE